MWVNGSKDVGSGEADEIGGGIDWTGSTTCVSGYVCTYSKYIPIFPLINIR
jgi:hypothetical protein